MANTFTPAPGTTYFNISGPRQGVTYGNPVKTSYPQSQYAVLGAQTSSAGNNTGGTSAPAAPAPSINTAQSNVNTQQDALKNQINSGFNDIFGQLDQQAGLLPGWQQQDESSLQNTYNQNLGSLNDSLTNANKSLDLSKQTIQQGVDKSVSDIQNSLRSLLKNAQSQIGSVGAGNSTAASQLVPYAFSKMYAQQRGNIQGQANTQFTDLAQKGLDVQNTFNNQKMNLDQWEQSNLQTIHDKYHGLLTDINNERVNATGQKSQALQGLQQTLLQQAYNDLNGIQQEAANNRSMLTQWALQRANDTQAANQAIGQAGQYSATPINYQQLQGVQPGQTASGGNDINSLVASLLGKKTDQSQ